MNNYIPFDTCVQNCMGRRHIDIFYDDNVLVRTFWFFFSSNSRRFHSIENTIHATNVRYCTISNRIIWMVLIGFNYNYVNQKEEYFHVIICVYLWMEAIVLTVLPPSSTQLMTHKVIHIPLSMNACWIIKRIQQGFVMFI